MGAIWDVNVNVVVIGNRLKEKKREKFWPNAENHSTSIIWLRINCWIKRKICINILLLWKKRNMTLDNLDRELMNSTSNVVKVDLKVLRKNKSKLLLMFLLVPALLNKKKFKNVKFQINKFARYLGQK